MPFLLDDMEAFLAKQESEVMVRVDKLKEIGWESYEYGKS